MTLYKLGRLGIRLLGDGSVAEYLTSEFESVRSAATPVHLRLSIVETLPDIEGAHFKPVIVAKSGFAVHGLTYDYSVAVSAHCLDVFVSPHSSPRARERYLPRSLKRCLDINFARAHEVTAKNILYDAFDYLSQVAQVDLGQTYVHSSAVAREGRAILFPAWGGVGKTTAMLRLVQNHGMQFLADDIAILSEDGDVHRNPKRIQVYGYNVQGDSRLRERLLVNRTFPDRLAWRARLKLRGPNAVRRRTSAEELFEADSIGVSAKVTDVILLERTDTKRFNMQEIPLRELAHRASWTLMRELDPFGAVSSATHAAGRQMLPTAAKLALATSRVIESACRSANVRILRIPQQASPGDLLKYLVEDSDLGIPQAKGYVR